MPQKLTTRAFVEKARAVHGERYGYEQVEYTRFAAKVKIICPEHGEFLQTPNNHLNGKGCPACGVATGAQKQCLSLTRFIGKAREIHGNAYDYPQADYQNYQIGITIICPVHGSFLQSPGNHLRSPYGCPSCGHEALSRARRANDELFIEKARAVHGEQYDYSRVKYTKSASKVLIVCVEHGEFLQAAGTHISGGGCPKCNVSHGYTRGNWIALQKSRKAVLYIILAEGKEEIFYKVGITYHSISSRFKSSAMPYQIKTVALYKSYDAGRIYDLETAIHRCLKLHRHSPKLKFGGETECFSSIIPALGLLPPETFFLKNRPIR